MKYCVFFFVFCTTILQAVAPTQLEITIVEILANKDIIVDQSSNPKLYRLGDIITRAETVGVALNSAEIYLPNNYFCKNYFQDVQYNPSNNWVCRAIETATDGGIISRLNEYARPNDPVTRIEALAIIMQAGRILYERGADREDYPKNMPQWQIDLLEGALQYHVITSTSTFGPNVRATRMDVFGMVYNMFFAGKNASTFHFTKKQYYNFSSAPEEITNTGTPTDIPESLSLLQDIDQTGDDGLSLNDGIPGNESRDTKEKFVGFSVTTIPSQLTANVPFSLTIATIDSSGQKLKIYSKEEWGDDVDMGYVEEGDIKDGDMVGDDLYSVNDVGGITLDRLTITRAGKWKFYIEDHETGIRDEFTLDVREDSAQMDDADAPTTLKEFIVDAPTEVMANAPFSITVSAIDSSGKIINSYRGRIVMWAYGKYWKDSFTNGNDTLTPPEGDYGNLGYNFDYSDAGKHTFQDGFLLKEIGEHNFILSDDDPSTPLELEKVITIKVK